MPWSGDWYNHAMYFGVFLLGFSLAGSRGAWVTLERARWITAGLAVLGWAFLSAYIGAYSDDAALPPLCAAAVRGIDLRCRAMARHRRRGGICASSSDARQSRHAAI